MNSLGGVSISKVTYVVIAGILLFLLLVGIRLLSGTRNEQVTFPIEGLELPRGSTIVEVSEMKPPDDPENGLIVWFDCNLPLNDVYAHVDSTLTNLGFTVVTESMPFSTDMFIRAYNSTKSNYTVMFTHYGDHKSSSIKFPKYCLYVGENSIQEEK